MAPARPTDPELRRLYSDGLMLVAQGLNEHRNDFYDFAVDVHAGFKKIHERLDAHGPATPQHPVPYERRHMLPSLTEYRPEPTDTGSFRITGEMWLALQQRIADQEAEARGYEQAQADQAKADAAKLAKTERRLKVVAVCLTAAGLVGSLATYLISHFGHP